MRNCTIVLCTIIVGVVVVSLAAMFKLPPEQAKEVLKYGACVGLIAYGFSRT
jgi:hypothetical protein